MGTFHNYNALKVYADKTIKFKQAVSIQAAAKSGLISPAHYQVAKDGACAALAMGWVAQTLGVGLAAGMFHRGDGPAADDMTSEITAGYSAPAFAAYARNRDDFGRIEAVRRLAGEFGLGIRREEVIQKESFDEAWLAVQRRNATRKDPYFISLGILGGGRHAVAAYADEDRDERISFFDPNFGGYLIHSGSTGKFFAAYQVLLMRHLHWVLGEAFAFPVTRV